MKSVNGDFSTRTLSITFYSGQLGSQARLLPMYLTDISS